MNEHLGATTDGINGGSRPVPDPTILTTQNLEREIAHVKESIVSLKELLELNVANVREVEGERFRSIDAQFDNSKEAIDAALSAQKEAAGKTEATVTTQITNIEKRIEDQSSNNVEKHEALKSHIASQIEDLKSLIGTTTTRMQAIESHRKGSENMTGFIVGAAGLVIALVVAVAGLASLFMKFQG